MIYNINYKINIFLIILFWKKIVTLLLLSLYLDNYVVLKFKPQRIFGLKITGTKIDIKIIIKF